MNQPARTFRPTASDRLDDAINALERLNDDWERVLGEYEAADAAFDRAYYMALLKSKASNQETRKAEAKLAALDQEVVLRSKRVALEAARERARNIREILQGLRSQVSSQRVGIQ